MLDFILIAIPTGIVSRLAKNKGYSPLSFGVATAILAFVGAFCGAYFFGFVGDLIGIVLMGVLMEEFVRNIPAKPVARKHVFCSQCGLNQDWDENKLCEVCGAALHK